MGNYDFPQSKHFEIKKLDEGVFAAVSKKGGGAVANSGIIDLGDKTVIFDTFNSPNAACDLADAAKLLTNKSVSYVINSHWHGDHIRGNQCFRDALIISSLATRNKMLEIHPDRISDQKSRIPQLLEHIEKLKVELETENDSAKAKKIRVQLDFLKEIESSLPGLEFMPPALTFENRMVFSGAKREAILQTYGGGHTNCDAFLYLPKEKIIFAGDLITFKNHPMLADGNPDNWLDILAKLKELPVTKVVPGHGNVSSVTAITEMEQYILAVQEIAKNISVHQKYENIEIPVPYQEWDASEIFVKNIEYLSKTNKTNVI